jgi:hypothetical protein
MTSRCENSKKYTDQCIVKVVIGECLIASLRKEILTIVSLSKQALKFRAMLFETFAELENCMLYNRDLRNFMNYICQNAAWQCTIFYNKHVHVYWHFQVAF